MKWNTSRRIALGIGLGVLAFALGLRFMGVARPILTVLHLVSLAGCGFALLVRDKPNL
jgi:hypothetical protein